MSILGYNWFDLIPAALKAARLFISDLIAKPHSILAVLGYPTGFV